MDYNKIIDKAACKIVYHILTCIFTKEYDKNVSYEVDMASVSPYILITATINRYDYKLVLNTRTKTVTVDVMEIVRGMLGGALPLYEEHTWNTDKNCYMNECPAKEFSDEEDYAIIDIQSGVYADLMGKLDPYGVVRRQAPVRRLDP